MRENDRWISDRQSIACDFHDAADTTPALRRWHAASEGANAHMFAEDVALHVVPYRMTGDTSVTLDPENLTAAKLVITALGSTAWRRPSLDEAVIDFVRACAADLLHFGVAQYEIVNYRRPGDEHDAFFTLERILPHTLRRKFRWFGKYRQRVAQGGREEQAGIVMVDPNRVITMRLPAEVSARQLYRIKASLAELGTTYLLGMTRRLSDRPANFDFNVALNQQTAFEATLTAAVGWNHRGGLAKHMTEYYYLTRELRFHAFVASVRDGIIADLNKVLALTLPKFGHMGQIRVPELPSRASVERIASRLEAGAHPRDIARAIRALP